MHILLVDDDEKSSEFLKEILTCEGYNVSISGSGQLALKAIEEDVDLVFLAVTIRDMNAFETARQIKIKKDIPIILLTTLQLKDKVLAEIDSNIDEVLSKPFLKEEVLLRVKSVLAVKYYREAAEAVALRRSKRIHRVLKKFADFNRDTILRLLLTTEYRDDRTGNHVIRVGKISRLIAQKLGLDRRVLDVIENAAQMHDLGKVGIPDSILLKRNMLTQDEFKVMKMHTLIGASILKDSKFYLIKVAYEVALKHHEKWDGSGYPMKIRKEEIPISARIAALADVFDSLNSERPYRNRFTWKESLDIVRQARGKHFDPRVVDAFFEELNEIKAIYDNHKDSGVELHEYNKIDLILNNLKEVEAYLGRVHSISR